MSAPRGRKRPREFKLGGQRAQQVQQARVNALATQFDKLGPDLRAPALAALHGRCKGSEKASLVQLYYKERTLAASERGVAALDTERKKLALECIKTLWHGAVPANIASELSELFQRAPARCSDAQGLLLPKPAAPSATSTTMSTATSTTAVGSSSASALGVTIETQTPTGLPQLLLAEALSWHGQSPSTSYQPEVSSIGVGTAAAFAASTSESHTQTVRDAPSPSMPRETASLMSSSSVEVGTSTISANEPPASGWAWGAGQNATTQTAHAASVTSEMSHSSESLGIQVMLDSSEELTAPSPQQAPLSARTGSTTDSGTSPLRFNDDLWQQ
jgi:plastocyanin